MKPVAKGGRQDAGATIPNNLPRYLTSFVKREGELAAIKAVLGRSRMVTLTGPGGVGKSRLASEACRASLDFWPDGVWWIELAPLNDPGQVAGSIVAALALPGHESAHDVIAAFLAERHALLVLDNCEHLVTACAEFSQRALERCPQLTIIATSREALGVSGEAQWPVASLRESDAVRLFEARATLVRPSFKVASSNLKAVTEICERVDRLPLAIELAAARVGVLTEQEMLSQLANRFRLLTGGNRTAPERHQTMTATIDWSYRLLSQKEAQLFGRLTVFRGGFTLESAQAICADSVHNILDVLTGLVQKSMVVAEAAPESGTRYRLLESQVAYAEDRLRGANELDLIQRRHYEYFRDRLAAKTRNPALAQPLPGLAESRWIAGELGNLWAAMGWARDNAVDLGLSLAANLALIRYTDIGRVRRLLADLLERSPEYGAPRVFAFRSAAYLANQQGDYDAVVPLTEAGLALARELGDVDVLALALASASYGVREPDIMLQRHREANSLLQGSSNRPLVNLNRNNLAWLAFVVGNYAGARDDLIECVATARAEGDVWGTGVYLDSLAWVQWANNELETADANFKESLAICRSFMDYADSIGGLQGVLCVAGARGNDQRVLRLAAAINRLSHERSIRAGDPWSERQAEEVHNRSRSKLGTRKSEEAWNQGWAMTLDQAIEYALGESEPETVIDAGPLTQREQQVARLVAAGMTNRQIGERLFITERSAEGHLQRMTNKLGVRSRTEVATWAVEHGLANRAQAPGEEDNRRSPSAGQRND